MSVWIGLRSFNPPALFMLPGLQEADNLRDTTTTSRAIASAGTLRPAPAQQHQTSGPLLTFYDLSRLCPRHYFRTFAAQSFSYSLRALARAVYSHLYRRRHFNTMSGHACLPASTTLVASLEPQTNSLQSSTGVTRRLSLTRMDCAFSSFLGLRYSP